VDWKFTDIVSVLKPEKDPTYPSSYHPVSLTSSVSKMAETMVNLRLDNFLMSNSIISFFDQAGFRSNRGTTDPVACVANAVKEGYKRHESTLAVSIDLSAAFDKTD
jgi:Reverse transcriptase (RNA-dependent DNA polymerase)